MTTAYTTVGFKGDRMYFKDPEKIYLHREDGPAIVFENGDKAWYIDGKIHRDGGQEYYKEGALHRVDGPAKIFENGTQAWYLDGIRHRDGGPAMIYNDSKIEVWYRHGFLHREDGPAVVDPTGATTAWWMDGECFSEEKFKEIQHNKSQFSGEF